MLVEWGEAYQRVLPRTNPVEIRIRTDSDDRIIEIAGLD
jgi:tRNA A37 threonylcarbamoyladenosine biosynthesis protein TsaE